MPDRKKIWICGACGRTAESRDALTDSSCRTWAVLCWEDTIVRGLDGRILKADAVKENQP